MASLPLTAISSLFTLLLVSLTPTIICQDPLTPGPTMTDCVSRLPPLAPCAPYVQGTFQLPVQACCDNVRQLYSEQPGCLCQLLNETNLSSLPINQTLVFQLPALCNIQVNVSACSGGKPKAPGSPASQVSLGTSNISSDAVPPVVEVTPKPVMGLGLGRSSSVELTKDLVAVSTFVAATIFFTITDYGY